MYEETDGLHVALASREKERGLAAVIRPVEVDTALVEEFQQRVRAPDTRRPGARKMSQILPGALGRTLSITKIVQFLVLHNMR